MKPKNVIVFKVTNFFSTLTDKQVILIVCFIGASIQTIYILNRFLEYDTLIQAHVGVPDATTIPDFNLCFDLLDVLNFTSLSTSYPFIVQELGYKPGTPITNGLIRSLRREKGNDFIFFSIGQFKINQLWQHVVSPSSVYTKAFAQKVSSDGVIEEPCSSTRFFIEQALCYSFSCSDGSNSSIVTGLNDLYKKLNKQEIFTILIDQSFFSSIGYYWVALTSRGKLPFGTNLKWESQQGFNVTRKHTFFFYTVEIHRLPLPYNSKCFDYSVKGFSSREEMNDQCKINLSLQYFGGPLPLNIIESPIDAPLGYIMFEKNRENASFLAIVSDIVDHCDHLTAQLDCFEIIYSPSSRTPLPIWSEHTEITIEQISDPVYIIRVEPKLTVLDVVISIGSILGSWLGFSIADSIPQVTSFMGTHVFKFTNKKKGRDFQIQSHSNDDSHIFMLPSSESIKYQNYRAYLQRYYFHRYPFNYHQQGWPFTKVKARLY
uniref:Uncharacterized protein n=1 Tax=Tetranychus urticae TaxID=32264 RepID=T1JTT7_TETUR